MLNLSEDKIDAVHLIFSVLLKSYSPV